MPLAFGTTGGLPHLHGRAVQVDTTKTHVESAYDFSA